MIAAALTIFRSGLFRAFTLIVHLILQNKITGYLCTRDPRYWRVIAVTVLLSPRLAARSFPGLGAAAGETRAALADGDHYREMAGKLRELARLTHSPGIRRELVDLAKRYDRRGEHFDGRPR